MNQREPDHLNLLCDIGELTSIVTGGSDIQTFLGRATELVATHLNAHVCSIYLFSPSEGELVLRATRGLNPKAVNQVRMKPGEGLVGRCFSSGEVLREGNAKATPGFKFFDTAGEEPFHSFLCLPIRRGVEKIGVLVVQHREMDHFTAFDARALKTAMTQLAGAIENARLLMALSPEPKARDTVSPPPALPAFIKGESNSGGSASGVIRPAGRSRKQLLYGKADETDPYTLAEFNDAMEKTVGELKALQEKFAASLPESASLIFTAHFMMLKDKNFAGKMEARIRQGEPPSTVIREIALKYIQIFEASPQAYLREKAVDVEDLSIRLLSNLTASHARTPVSRGTIAVARELYPSDILKLSADGIKGIILVGGGITSHVTILSRSLKIPMILTGDARILDLPPDTRLLMDGGQGNIYINPDEKTLALFDTKTRAEDQARHLDMADRTLTLDNHEIKLLANINLLSEVGLAIRLKAKGVGLYRTEFPFLIRPDFPSEDEQYLIYKNLFDQTGTMSVTTVRTLDAGGEKTLSYTDAPKEANPVLGLRSIRFALRYREVFESQVRAILRAAHTASNVRIMFPLISSVDEFLLAREVVGQCIRNLAQEGVPHRSDVKIGMMIELPSVLSIIEDFAALADFFAIGTNDFVQYMVGADRGNKLVADLYQPCHPSVLRGIKTIARAGETHGIDVSVCGEMAHDPVYIPFLIGAGISTLSIDPQFLPMVQKTVMALSMDEARSHAALLLAQTRISETRKLLDARAGE